MNHKKEVGPEMELIIKNMNYLVDEHNIDNSIQRNDEAEASGNTAASSPKVHEDKQPQASVNDPDDSSIT